MYQTHIILISCAPYNEKYNQTEKNPEKMPAIPNIEYVTTNYTTAYDATVESRTQ